MAYPNDFGDGDLDTFFADFAVPFVFGATTTVCIKDEGTVETKFEGEKTQVTAAEASVCIKVHDFPTMPKKNDTVVIDGTTAYVNRVIVEADGRTARLWYRS